jgi:ABC-type dipeptide/oligopeptide/nickel transport system permease subunit
MRPRIPVPAFQRRIPGSSYIAFSALAVVVVATIFCGVLTRYSPDLPVALPFSAPSGAHWLGTDEIGRDVFSRVLLGMRSSWWGGVGVILSGVVIGGLIGLAAGTIGGLVDSILMRITDLFLALPGAVLAVAVVGALGPSYFHTLFAVSIVWWPLYARVVRGEITRLRASPHIEAARVAGSSRMGIAFRHLLPGAVPPTIICATQDVGGVILTLAGLSFIGLGQPEPAPELGSMSQQGLTYLFNAWWIPILPAVAVAVLVLVANFAGDAVRDLLSDR